LVYGLHFFQKPFFLCVLLATVRTLLVESIPMRSSRKDAKAPTPQAFEVSPNASSGSGLQLQNMMGLMMSMFQQAQQMQGNQMQAEQNPLIQFCNPPQLQQLQTQPSQLQQPQTQPRLPSYQLRGYEPLTPRQENSAALNNDKAEDPTMGSLSMSEATGALLADADAAATAADGKRKKMKRPAAAPKAALTKKVARKPAGRSFDSLTAAQRLAARPDGCSKCRGKAGCTKSCWTKKTNPF
jgi:hypothetical protein